jgi:hypothetical protein
MALTGMAVVARRHRGAALVVVRLDRAVAEEPRFVPMALTGMAVVARRHRGAALVMMQIDRALTALEPRFMRDVRVMAVLAAESELPGLMRLVDGSVQHALQLVHGVARIRAARRTGAMLGNTARRLLNDMGKFVGRRNGLRTEAAVVHRGGIFGVRRCTVPRVAGAPSGHLLEHVKGQFPIVFGQYRCWLAGHDQILLASVVCGSKVLRSDVSQL